MEIPNYTQADNSKVCGVVSLLSVIGAYKEEKVKSYKNITKHAERFEKKYKKGSPWGGTIYADLALMAIDKGFKTTAYRKIRKVPTFPTVNIKEYFIRQRKRALEKGMKEIITKNIGRILLNFLKEGKPLIVLIDPDFLYETKKWYPSQWWAHWIVAKSYDRKKDEIVIHDPAGYLLTALYPNCPRKIIGLKNIKGFRGVIKNHYLRIDRKHFMEASKRAENITARDLKNPKNRKITKPFTQEFLLIEP